MLIELATLILSRVLNILREPLVEFIMRIEQTRHDEMQQGPQLYRMYKFRARKSYNTVTHLASSSG